MCSIPKLILVATFAILCTQFMEAQHLTKGKLVLIPEPMVFSPAAQKIPTKQSSTKENPCCWHRPRCCLSADVDKIKGIKRIDELGILIDLPKDSSVVVEEASIEIYSKTNKLVFSTEAKCDGCDKTLSSKATGNSTSYLMTLDKTAALAAQPHFVKGNKLVVVFKAEGKGMPDTVYFVNAKEGKPVK